jgi:hypothetical protein
MNLDQLKRNVGYRMKLVPAACHLNEHGDVVPPADEDWIVQAVTDELVEIASVQSSYVYRLGKDHIRNFTTDPNRDGDGLKHGFLTLHVQLFARGYDVWAVPNPQPGVAVAPPSNLANRARAALLPEMERVMRRQIAILDRVVVNYSQTSHGRPSVGDTWASLRPNQPSLYATSTVLKDLSAADTALFSEFYAAVQEVTDLLASLQEFPESHEYNAWNILMHKVEESLRAGERAFAVFCPHRSFDPVSPAAGTMLSQSSRVLASAGRMRSDFLARAALQGVGRN